MKNSWTFVFVLVSSLFSLSVMAAMGSAEEITIYNGQSRHAMNKDLRITAQNCKTSAADSYYSVQGQEYCGGSDPDSGNWTCRQMADCEYGVYNKAQKLYTIPSGKLDVICGMPNTGDLTTAQAMATCKAIPASDCVKNSQWSNFKEVTAQSRKILDEKGGARK